MESCRYRGRRLRLLYTFMLLRILTNNKELNKLSFIRLADAG